MDNKSNYSLDSGRSGASREAKIRLQGGNPNASPSNINLGRLNTLVGSNNQGRRYKFILANTRIPSTMLRRPNSPNDLTTKKKL